jgi:voltage-gated potassium channel Kch
MATKKKQPTPRQRIEKIKDNIRYERVALAATGFIIFGAVFYHFVEKLSWIDSFYFTTVTLATVGYGDISPRTDAGKVFTIFYMLIGISIFVVLARIVLGRLILRSKR